MRLLNIYDVMWAARESKGGPRFPFDIKLDGQQIYAMHWSVEGGKSAGR